MTITAPERAEIFVELQYVNEKSFGLLLDTPSVNSQFLDRAIDAIRGLDGVTGTRFERYEETLRVDVLTEFFEPRQIARVAEVRFRNELANAAPVVVRTRVAPYESDSYYSIIETDYRHTDGRLLDELGEAGLREPSFVNGGYNIVGVRPVALSNRKVRRVINQFYAGQMPTQALDVRRVDKSDSSNVELLINRKVPQESRRELVQILLEQVEGISDVNFEGSGHRVRIFLVNRFFSKSQIAIQVLPFIEEFFQKLAKDSRNR